MDNKTTIAEIESDILRRSLMISISLALFIFMFPVAAILGVWNLFVDVIREVESCW